MLDRYGQEFCVEHQSQISESSHMCNQNNLKTPNIVSWPECQPELPSDGGDGDGGDIPRNFPIW